MITKDHVGEKVLMIKSGLFNKYSNPEQRDITELSPSGNYFRYNNWSEWHRSDNWVVVEILGEAKP